MMLLKDHLPLQRQSWNVSALLPLMDPFSVFPCRRLCKVLSYSSHTAWCASHNCSLVPDAKILNSGSPLCYIQSYPSSNTLKTAKKNLQSVKAIKQIHIKFLLSEIYTSQVSIFQKRQSLQATYCESHFTGGFIQMTQGESVPLLLYSCETDRYKLITFLQYEVPSDYAITSNFSISKEPK